LSSDIYFPVIYGGHSGFDSSKQSFKHPTWQMIFFERLCTNGRLRLI
jgi:hypothetical protein